VTDSKKYISATVKGFFKKGSSHLTGDYNFSELVFYSGDVSGMNPINDLLLEEHCVGKYYKSNRHETLRCFVSENEFIEERIKHFVIRDIIAESPFHVDGHELIPFSGNILFEISKPPITIPNQTQQSTSGSVNGSLLGSVKNIFTSPFQTLTGVNPSLNTNASNGKPLNSILALAIGCLLLLIIIGSFLYLAGIPPLISFLIPGLILLSVFMHGLIQKNPNLAGYLGVKRPLLNAFGWLLFLTNLVNLIQKGTSPSIITGFIFGIALMMLSRTGKILRIIGWVLLGFILVYNINFKSEWLDDWNFDVEKEDKLDEQKIYETDFDSSYVKTSQNDSVKVKFRVHKFNWKDNSEQSYSGTFKVREDHYNITRLKREKLEVKGANASTYWQQVYANLLDQNSTYLENIIAEYKSIIKQKKLDETAAADMIVSSVQNIPYCLVHDLTHKQAEISMGGFITEWHQKGGACLELIKYGLQSPTEFMGNFMGDCDTRSVMLYHVLNSLGYNTVIMTSEEYGHAIIGISGNYRGKSKYHDGLKYYAWETTFPGYEPGVLSNECGNMRYWNVVLEFNKQ
jgi:hypothetical protein